MKPKSQVPLSELSQAELEASLEAALERCKSKNEDEAREAEARYALLTGEIEYRVARLASGKASEEGQDAHRYMVSLTVSRQLFTRLEGLVRMEGRLLQEIFLEAVVREADRLERKAMVEKHGEGRRGLIRYRRDRRRGKELRK